jgi:hypothetical protein
MAQAADIGLTGVSADFTGGLTFTVQNYWKQKHILSTGKTESLHLAMLNHLAGYSRTC